MHYPDSRAMLANWKLEYRVIVERLLNNPIIVPHMDARMGENINGPSLIRAPSWVARPLGRYYLYFAHHQGKYIRLAYADELTGPWQTYEPGVLDLERSFFVKHIASPDVVVDEARREVRLYYHGPLAPEDREGRHGRYGQATRVALSSDGRHFTPRREVLGAPYFRVFRWRGDYYAMARAGLLYRSDDGLTSFEEGHNPLTGDVRHVALDLVGDTLWVYYSVIGECPERIYRSRIELTPDWTRWKTISAPELVLQPERDWEGANEERLPSRGGAIHRPAYQLRDPAIFREDGRTYLLYSVAGERGIALAELRE